MRTEAWRGAPFEASRRTPQRSPAAAQLDTVTSPLPSPVCPLPAVPSAVPSAVPPSRSHSAKRPQTNCYTQKNTFLLSDSDLKCAALRFTLLHLMFADRAISRPVLCTSTRAVHNCSALPITHYTTHEMLCSSCRDVCASDSSRDNRNRLNSVSFEEDTCSRVASLERSAARRSRQSVWSARLHFRRDSGATRRDVITRRVPSSECLQVGERLRIIVIRSIRSA